MVSCSAKIELYYKEYFFEMRNDTGVDVELQVDNNSSFLDRVVLKDGESVQWRTNSGIYSWPFDNVDTVAVTVYYNDIYLVEYGDKKGMTPSRNPGDVKNYVEKKIDDLTYSLVYTFTKQDYQKAQQ